MPRSVALPAAILMLTAVLAANADPTAVRAKRVTAQSSPAASLAPSTGVPLFASIPFPSEFAPLADRAPIWLQDGAQLAVIGKQGNRDEVLSFSGRRFAGLTILFADPDDAPDSPRILDFAARPDSMMAAVAVAHPEAGQVEVLTREFGADQELKTVAQIEGRFDKGRLEWLDRTTLALGLSAADAPAETAHALYTINVRGQNLARRITLDCEQTINPGAVHWAADGKQAIAEQTGGSPMLIGTAKPECAKVALKAPYAFRFLGWNYKATEFVYAGSLNQREAEQGISGIYLHDAASGADAVVASPAAAAAFLPDDTVAVLGNRQLTPRLLVTRPQMPMEAEMALIEPRSRSLTITPMGISTRAAMLTRGAISHASASDWLVAEFLVPGAHAPMVAIAGFNTRTSRSVVLAFSSNGEVPVSWSPERDLIALLDYGGSIAIVSPPP